MDIRRFGSLYASVEIPCASCPFMISCSVRPSKTLYFPSCGKKLRDKDERTLFS